MGTGAKPGSQDDANPIATKRILQKRAKLAKEAKAKTDALIKAKEKRQKDNSKTSDRQARETGKQLANSVAQFHLMTTTWHRGPNLGPWPLIPCEINQCQRLDKIRRSTACRPSCNQGTDVPCVSRFPSCPEKLRSIKKHCNAFRILLEGECISRHGSISATKASLIQTAVRWEQLTKTVEDIAQKNWANLGSDGPSQLA